MNLLQGIQKYLKKRRKHLLLNGIALGVLFSGLFLLYAPLHALLIRRTGAYRAPAYTLLLPLFFGVTLVYLSTLLRRRKRAAWNVSVGVFMLILLFGFIQYFRTASIHRFHIVTFTATIVLPVLALIILLQNRRLFSVKSGVSTVQQAARRIVIILLAAILYGVVGFQLLDTKDFQREINIPQSIVYTLDQFNFLTPQHIQPHTHRAVLFLDSLSYTSGIAAFYMLLSLFSPLGINFLDMTEEREHVRQLLEKYPTNSEDFFKLWPHDKQYFFNPGRTSVLAYTVKRGVALCVGDPLGDPASFPALISLFNEFCRLNDWLPALIHVDKSHTELYEKYGFAKQKIGEEAIVQIEHFQTKVRKDKYFRQITNRYAKLAYTTEVLLPPHNAAIIDRLRSVSADWLKQPGRDERVFMMGQFNEAYLQQCPIVVARDAAGTIQAFINQLPKIGEPTEANYDMLRHTKESPGNVNDFLLMGFIERLQQEGYKTLNLGLCPLAGMLKNRDDDKTVIDSALQFVYANGDRFYSFAGLYRFKSKYEPHWSGRYIAYKGGIRGFTRTLTALNTAMKPAKHHLVPQK
jgi:phosphatidylglycerol lysyltransferase